MLHALESYLSHPILDLGLFPFLMIGFLGNKNGVEWTPQYESGKVVKSTEQMGLSRLQMVQIEYPNH